MPREVVSIAIGQCGIQLTKEMWGLLATEHDLDLTGQRLNYRSHVPNTMYAESDGDFFIPRTVIVDSENSVIDAIRYGAMKDTFDPMHIINGNECASNCFARGKFIVMKKKHEEVKNSIRQQLEGCNSVACILMANSSGGGTGSGYGVHILEYMHDEHSKVKRNSITVLPSRTLSTSTVEPYNAMFTASAMLDGTELSVNIQNEALYNICSFKSPLYSEEITYCHLNQLISQIFSSMTVSIRSPGNLHVDLSEFNTNLVPFPRISNVLASISPIQPKSLRPIHPNTNTITVNSFSKRALTASSVDFEKGLYIASTMLYRGKVNAQECTDAVWSLKKEGKILRFVPWMTTGVKIGINSKEMTFPENSLFESPKRAVVQLLNHTQYGNLIGNLIVKFDMMHSPYRAFVNFYTQNGMEDAEFETTREVMGLLHTDYKEVNGSTATDFA